MRSPFPGMDPYLEGSLWTTLHHALAVEIIRQIGPGLRPRYLALAGERFVAEADDGISITSTYPDVGVTPADSIAELSRPTPSPPPPLLMETVIPAPVPHLSVEIRTVGDRRLVTAIEILSPTNKRAADRHEYLARRQRFLHSSVHLLEIDLLRRGHRVPMRQPLPEAPYFAFLSRTEQRPTTEVWPIALTEPLPAVPVPLLAEDPDLPLDLQRAFDEVYNLSSYDLAINYAQPPDVPFTEREAELAERILERVGMPRAQTIP